MSCNIRNQWWVDVLKKFFFEFPPFLLTLRYNHVDVQTISTVNSDGIQPEPLKIMDQNAESSWKYYVFALVLHTINLTKCNLTNLRNRVRYYSLKKWYFSNHRTFEIGHDGEYFNNELNTKTRKALAINYLTKYIFNNCNNCNCGFFF